MSVSLLQKVANYKDLDGNKKARRSGLINLII